nr:MAG TPA_asm: serine/threonine acetyltransferase [Caudoviricetes sp.]DAO58451.1 MAG TPA: serine/threonine acetyltransferase [Caudoviricetes sp.]
MLHITASRRIYQAAKLTEKETVYSPNDCVIYSLALLDFLW